MDFLQSAVCEPQAVFVPMGKNDKNVIIGEIVSTFGRKGEVKVRSYTDFPEHFEEIGDICVAGEKTDRRMYKIENVRYHKGAVLLKFAGIDDISAAETLRNAKLLIGEAELIPLEEDEYYIHDILGLDVVTTEGEHLGKVKEVLRSPAHDVYVTERAMIPAVKEFVVSIDLHEKKIVVRLVEGLVQE